MKRHERDCKESIVVPSYGVIPSNDRPLVDFKNLIAVLREASTARSYVGQVLRVNVGFSS